MRSRLSASTAPVFEIAIRDRGDAFRTLDARKLSTRDAEKLTGVAHSEFSRLHNAQRRRFSLDRLIAIVGRLDGDVEGEVSFRTRDHAGRPAPRAARGPGHVGKVARRVTRDRQSDFAGRRAWGRRRNEGRVAPRFVMASAAKQSSRRASRRRWIASLRSQ